MGIKGVLYLFQYVSDLDRSARFYADGLGFGAGTKETHIRGFRFGSGHLALHVDDRPENERVYEGGAYVAVEVEDVDAYHADLRARGVAVGEIRDWPWGERSFRVADPDGYVWTFAAVPRAEGGDGDGDVAVA